MILIVATACTSATEVAVKVPPGQMVRYLALGDSYTIGERVDSVDRWPDRLARELESAGIPLVDLQIIAQTGWTTSELDAAIDGVDPQGRFGLVSLLIGVNNQFRGADIAEYRTEFVGLLNRAIGFAGGDPSRVIVVSIPDWGVTPFASSYDPAQIAEEIDAFNAVAELEAVAAGSHWVDITPTSRNRRSGFVADDGLHPSRSQYAAWVELILPVAQQVLFDA